MASRFLLLLTHASVILLSAAMKNATTEMNTTTTYSGYLVDLYCYGIVRGGGLALDGTDVIRDPSQHTVHCMRDPPQCYENGFYLALKQADGYHIGFKLDEEGNRRALELLRSIPVGSHLDHKGNFTVTATGRTSGDGFLRDVTIMRCDGGGCDSVCEGDFCDNMVPSDFDLQVKPLLWVHGLCMVASWGCLLPFGVICARVLKTHPRKVAGIPIWFAGHRTIQTIGWALQIIGFASIAAHRGTHHFKTPHEVLGLIVTILGTLQPFQAQLRHLKCIGHAQEDGTVTFGRMVWECSHKGFGYAAVCLGILNVLLGILYAEALGFQDVFFMTIAALTTLSFLSLLSFWGGTKVWLRKGVDKAANEIDEDLSNAAA